MSRYNLLVPMALAVVWAMSAEISNAQNCPANESPSICSKYCEPSCADKDPVNNNWLCRLHPCIQFSTPICRCNNNFVRNNTTGLCIPPKMCPNN